MVLVRIFIVCHENAIGVLVSSLTGLDSVVSVHKNKHIFSCLEESNAVQLETSHAVIPTPKASGLWLAL